VTRRLTPIHSHSKPDRKGLTDISTYPIPNLNPPFKVYGPIMHYM